jgi:hypothetical protein
MTCRFDVDDAAVDQARQQLGVRLAVRVLKRRYVHKTGRYIGIRCGVHYIGVDVGLSPAEASRVVWHELTHAAQAERYGGLRAFDRQWFAEMQQVGISRVQATRAQGRRYDSTPLEREASANERHHRKLRLTRRSQLRWRIRWFRRVG